MKNSRIHFALLILIPAAVWIIFGPNSPLLSGANKDVSENAQLTNQGRLESKDSRNQDRESDSRDMITGTETKDVEDEIEIPVTLRRTPQTYFDPADIIERHLEKAELGDPTSKFVIAEVGLFCRNAPSSQESLDSILSDPLMDKFLMRRSKESFERCAQLKLESTRALDANRFSLTSGKHDQFPLYRLRYGSIGRECNPPILSRVYS